MSDQNRLENGTVKIGVSKTLERDLRHDAESFEVFRGKEQETDVNRFLNLLIRNYYDDYMEEINRRSRDFRSILSGYIKDPRELEEAVGRLIVKEDMEDEEARKADGWPFTFRPLEANVPFINGILLEMDKMNQAYSGGLRRLLYNYSRKPAYERERIIYHDTAEKLKAACADKNAGISFYYRDNPAKHTVTPYKLIYGLDGQHNYFLCQEYNEERRKMIAVTYRLSRITDVSISARRQPLEEKVLRYLKKMEEYSPQHSINEDTETCVELTAEGRKVFRSIYLDRPIRNKPKKKEKPDEKGRIRYYFSCSQEQLFFYFRRFNPGTARIIKPEKLKNELRKFHRLHLEELGE